MNIVFFARYFYPHIGGVEKHLLELSLRLVRKGYQVTVIAEMDEQRAWKREIYKGIRIYRIPINVSEREKKYRIWQWLFKHRRFIQKADIIHCHDVFYWYLPFRLIFPQKKVFTTFHGYEGNILPTKKAIFMHKFSEKLSFGNICVGDYLKKWYRTKPTITTYGAVYAEEKENEKNFQQGSELHVVFIGRLDPEASIMGYLKVIQLLVKSGMQIKCTVLGEGKLRKNAEAYVNAHKLPVTFIGNQKDVSPFLRKADFVFTSRYLSTLESFIEKKYAYCLYTNDIHRDCFLLSPFASWMTITNKPSIILEEILKEKENQQNHKEKVENAYKWAKKQTWSNLVKQYELLWQINS